MTLEDVSEAVRRGTLDLSAGRIETRDAQVRVRTTGQRYDQQDFEELVVLSRTDGTLVRLGDIAEVRDGFRSRDLIVRYQGRPAAFIEVYRAADEQVLDVTRAVEEFVDREVVPSLPAGTGISIWNNDAEAYRERLSLLLENGFLGLLLVLVALALFLEIRLTVTADVDGAAITAGEVNDILATTVLPVLADASPGLTYLFGGEQQQQSEFQGGLLRGFVLALLVIYALLAIPLESYVKPLIVMAAVPFGVVGAILGHLILGIDMTFASTMGAVALCGVVVNDSLVMMDFIDQRLREGAPARAAVIEGAKGRFRPIFLTSLTTFLGFTPLLLETAPQARFLIPFGASIGFGVAIATAMLMLVVPALTTAYLQVAPSPRSAAVRAATAG